MEKDRDYKGSAHHVHEQVPWYLRIHSTALSVVCGGVGTAVATAVTGPAAAISAVAKGQNGLKAYTNSVSNGWYGGCEEGSVLSTGKWRPIDWLGNFKDLDHVWDEDCHWVEKEEEKKEICTGHVKPASFLYDVLKSEAFLKGKYAGTEKVTAESTWKVLEEEGDKIIDQIDDIVIEKIFLEKFEETEFMRLYMKTPRKSPLSEVIEDLKKVMPQHTHAEMDEFAEDHKNDPITAVMHIWTKWTPITMPINFALMLDGYETFGLVESDSLKTDAIKKRLAKENGHDYKTILKYSIKFIRMVNYCIVYKCTKLNTEDRVTYRGVAADIFKNVKVGQTFRVMNFNCTSSNSKVSEKFSKFNTEGTPDATMIVFQIPKGCYNAGKIEEYGYKYHKYEKETLIPPYTACKLTKRDGNTLYVEVAKDNKAVSFTHFTF